MDGVLPARARDAHECFSTPIEQSSGESGDVLNLPGSSRHSEALNLGANRGCHEQQALPGELLGRGGQIAD
jgi:hypothetical protein